MLCKRQSPFVLLLLLPLLVLVVACAGFKAGGVIGPKNPMLGKWKPLDAKADNLTMEITEGEMTTSAPNGKSLTSTYRFLDAATIETETPMFGQKMKNTYVIAVNGDDMTWTDQKGVVKRFKRVM